MSGSWPWVPLIVLGAYHGLNPGMGWLFAVARGLQERSRAAVAWSLVPIALGHAVAIAIAVAVVQFVQTVLPIRAVKIVVAFSLFAMAAYRLFRSRHPQGGGMRVGFRDLSLWSFMMACSHGAGLMLMPILLAHPGQAAVHDMAMPLPPLPSSPWFAIGAVVVHTASLLGVAGAVAMVVYETYDEFGLSFLRHAWFNFDLLWAIALFAAGVVALFT